MLLHVFGASCVGKSTARVLASRELGAEFETIELWNLGPLPEVPTVAWRQEGTEQIVRRAIELESEGRHLLYAGDPVPIGEVLAVPSADRIDVASILFDITADEHDARLEARNDPPEWRHLHHGFAEWMRHHRVDPRHVPEAITNDAWDGMRWERFLGADAAPDIADRWETSVIDVSDLTPPQTAAALMDWCARAVAGEAPVFRAGWYR